MTPPLDRADARDHEFGEMGRGERESGPRLTIEDLRPVTLDLTVDLGYAMMLVRDVLELKTGSVVRLNKVAGETTDVSVGGLPFSKGEIVVIGDSLHVRIGDLTGAEERMEDDASAH